AGAKRDTSDADAGGAYFAVRGHIDIAVAEGNAEHAGAFDIGTGNGAGLADPAVCRGRDRDIAVIKRNAADTDRQQEVEGKGGGLVLIDVTFDENIDGACTGRRADHAGTRSADIPGQADMNIGIAVPSGSGEVAGANTHS